MSYDSEGESTNITEIEPGTLLVSDKYLRFFVMNSVPNQIEQAWPFRLAWELPCAVIIRGIVQPSSDSEGLLAAAKRIANQNFPSDDLDVSSHSGEDEQDILSNPEILRELHNSNTVTLSLYIILQSSSLDELETATSKLRTEADEANIDLFQIEEDYRTVFGLLDPEEYPMDDRYRIGMMGLAAMLSPRSSELSNEEMWDNNNSGE
jgi:hypothetical protein